MFKHPACGGQHETVEQARQCERVNGAVRTHLQTAENQTLAEVPAESLAEINADQETWPWSHRNGKDQHPFDMGRRYHEAAAELGVRVLPWDQPLTPITENPFNPVESPRAHDVWAEFHEVTGHEEQIERHYTPRTSALATQAQVDFIKILLEQRDWTMENLGTDDFERAMDVCGGKDITKSEASSLIPALKALPRKAGKPEATQAKEQPWRRLSREVPAGYYAVTDAERKNHFYRVSVGRNGFFKVQEQASDDLHFVPLNRYADILQHILDFGLDKAGQFYATERSACRKCNRTLTDNVGNPYFAAGFGPECGGK